MSRKIVVTPELLESVKALREAAKAVHSIYRDSPRKFIDNGMNRKNFADSVIEKFEIEEGIAGDEFELDYLFELLEASVYWNPKQRVA